MPNSLMTKTMIEEDKKKERKKYNIRFVHYPRIKTFKKRIFSDDKEFYFLEEALHEVNEKLNKNWSIKLLLKKMYESGIELHCQVNELPLFEEINETTYKKGYGTVGLTIGYGLTIYTGYFNISKATNDIKNPHRYLYYLAYPPDNPSEIEGLNSIDLWHEDGCSTFFIADNSADLFYGDDLYSYDQLEWLLDEVEVESILANILPQKVLKPTENQLLIEKWRFNYWLNGFQKDNEKVEEMESSPPNTTINWIMLNLGYRKKTLGKFGAEAIEILWNGLPPRDADDLRKMIIKNKDRFDDEIIGCRMKTGIQIEGTYYEQKKLIQSWNPILTRFKEYLKKYPTK